jgi:hypothetical protein
MKRLLSKLGYSGNFKKRDDVGIHGYTLNDTAVVGSGRSS